jgi:ABC-type Fe3+-hydroxamate transport system substrate-binding protein
MKKTLLVILILYSLITTSGCMSASQHRKSVQDNSSDRVTVGTVQREIRIGMSAADVIGILGSPNIVTTDEERREVWVYDKIATDRVYSSSSGGVNALILGGGVGGTTLLGGGIGAGGSGSAGDSAYHTSRF